MKKRKSIVQPLPKCYNGFIKFKGGIRPMEKQIFTNDVILAWLQYYAKNTEIDLEHVKIIDITKKNKNVIPTVEAHKTTLVFTNAGIDDISTVCGMSVLGNAKYGTTKAPTRPVRFYIIM